MLFIAPKTLAKEKCKKQAQKEPPKTTKRAVGSKIFTVFSDSIEKANTIKPKPKNIAIAFSIFKLNFLNIIYL